MQNTLDGISMVQTGEGALNEVHAILQRVRELAVEYNNGTLSAADRAAITVEIAQLSAEVGRIATTTQFNGLNLLQTATPVTFQVGANAGETIVLTGANLGGTYFDSVFTAFTPGGADITAVERRRSRRSPTCAPRSARAQNRLEHTVKNLAVYQENLSAAESRVRDVDMAAEMVNLTRLQILNQSGTAMLSQANQLPQSVLSLLRQ